MFDLYINLYSQVTPQLTISFIWQTEVNHRLTRIFKSIGVVQSHLCCWTVFTTPQLTGFLIHQIASTMEDHMESFAAQMVFFFNSISHVVHVPHVSFVHYADTASCVFQPPALDDVTKPSTAPTPTTSPIDLTNTCEPVHVLTIRESVEKGIFFINYNVT